MRYCARPALANDRLSKRADGRYLLRLKTPWRDGTTHLYFEPIELMERLAAQIPKPRINLVLYAGVLAPNAKLRKRVVVYARPEPLPEPPATETQTRAEKESWSEVMRSTFGLDVLACARPAAILAGGGGVELNVAQCRAGLTRVSVLACVVRGPTSPVVLKTSLTVNAGPVCSPRPTAPKGRASAISRNWRLCTERLLRGGCVCAD